MKDQNINIPNNFGDTNYSTHRFQVLKGRFAALSVGESKGLTL